MFVYRVTNKINGKIYIGKYEGRRVEDRWRMHIRATERGSPLYFHRAIRLYKPHAFTVEVIYQAKNSVELCKMETFFIVLYQSFRSENGYNMTMGGDTPQMTPERRKKLSEVGKRRYAAGLCEGLKLGPLFAPPPPVLTPEQLRHVGQRAKETHTGVSLSEEHIRHMSEARTGVPLSEKHCEALHLGAKKTWTPARKKRQAEIIAELRKKNPDLSSKAGKLGAAALWAKAASACS